MYVAVKGGEKAIDAAHEWLAETRRGDGSVEELSIAQIRSQLRLAVDRVMSEGSLYDPELAALALKQASGDTVEAVFLVRAYRTTLPRFVSSQPLETNHMAIQRRISATYKDVPGGQVLGPTYDYTHRLLDFTLMANGEAPQGPEPSDEPVEACPRVLDMLNREGLIEGPDGEAKADRNTSGKDDEPGDITRDPLTYPANRATRLQALARGDEGFLLALGYSTQRGYGRNHPFAGEIRYGTVAIEILPEELGFPIVIGDMDVTECDMINQFGGSATEAPRFTRGYGLTFGQGERKVMAMALVDRALRAKDLGEELNTPAQDEEFVLSHCDNLDSSGFVSHLKLPHYVDFQSELVLLRQLRREFHQRKRGSEVRQAATETHPRQESEA
ncbi:alpha-D-ribose 1-methylphosphonate 5-triphosphate synthase subunit PhnI [Marinobacter antarcticus]|uniref:Alpha-D-ribose 1-methylphosphonate 5-triphosphate synthase subunit PhnI n=1 Tax=Marinobacter antarcticus TaxID=564117 RepID=A0A1M6UC94_9GAMM|nr:carbon-phosphorus lyase complex subunit PhnI [Marinobacter antarcticus]SHK66806.1 alpha-D-ribose 1-methylphosphonate 5-triphosphate synthase subunit PhnI [Marinobacter antarcticus]